MAELIDRQALGIGRAKPEAFTRPEYANGWNSAIEAINAAPTVDAVEVVRCKDCKHYKRGIVFKDTMFCFRPDEYGGPYVIRSKDDHFCSYGERREDDG